MTTSDAVRLKAKKGVNRIPLTSVFGTSVLTRIPREIVVEPFLFFLTRVRDVGLGLVGK